MIEAMKQALEALEKERPYLGPMPTLTIKAITSLQQAIAKLESQEPVAWIAPRYEGGHENLEVVDEREFGAFRVYTHPPQRTWVGLTDEEKHKIWYEMQNIMGWYSFQEIANAIEAKLKERNT